VPARERRAILHANLRVFCERTSGPAISRSGRSNKSRDIEKETKKRRRIHCIDRMRSRIERGRNLNVNNEEVEDKVVEEEEEGDVRVKTSGRVVEEFV